MCKYEVMSLDAPSHVLQYTWFTRLMDWTVLCCSVNRLRACLFFSSPPFRDPDNVVLCILATDDEDVKDVALQIHFTLIQAFCCENDINILRVNNTQRLAEILGGGGGKQSGGEPMDLHCVLVTVSLFFSSIHMFHSVLSLVRL